MTMRIKNAISKAKEEEKNEFVTGIKYFIENATR